MLEEMRVLYLERHGTKQIAKKFNLPVTTTRNYLLKAGVEFKKSFKDKVPISQHQAKYIQGFADFQGSVPISTKQVILCNQNLAGLKEMEELLGDIGIKNISYNKNGIILKILNKMTS